MAFHLAEKSPIGMDQACTLKSSLLDSCMADLGRHRQDELLLGEWERNGSSFTPGSYNGTGHYSKKLKEDLKAQWNVAFKDIESEQMKGLSIEDSRPWAQKASRKTEATSALPDKKLSSRARKSSDIVVQSLPSKGRKNRIHSATKQLSQQLVPSNESIWCKGSCSITNRDSVEIHGVYYTMKVDLRTDHGYLVFERPGKSLKTLDMFDIDPPHMENDSYIVIGGRGVGDERFSVKLEDATATACFKSDLERLRRAALHLSLSEAAAAPPPSTTRQLSSESNKHQSRDFVDLTSSEVTMPLPATISCHLSSNNSTNQTWGLCDQPSLESATAPPTSIRSRRKSHDRKIGRAWDLVDLELKIEDSGETCEGLGDFCRRVTSELCGGDLSLLQNASEDIRAMAIESWLKRGFIDDESDNLKADLLGLLRILGRIEHKINMRLVSASATTSLADMDSDKVFSPRAKYPTEKQYSPRTQYTIEKIKGLRTNSRQFHQPLFIVQKEETLEGEEPLKEEESLEREELLKRKEALDREETSGKEFVEAAEPDALTIKGSADVGISPVPEPGFIQSTEIKSPSSGDPKNMSELKELSTAQVSIPPVPPSRKSLRNGGLKASLWSS